MSQGSRRRPRAGRHAVPAKCAHHDCLISRVQSTPQKPVRQWLLSTFMVDAWPDPIRFLGAVRGLIMSTSAAAKADRPVVAAFGEMVALLWAEGKTDAAIQLEQLWNDLATTHDVDVLCAYPFNCFAAEQEEQSLRRISACHSAVSRA